MGLKKLGITSELLAATDHIQYRVMITAIKVYWLLQDKWQTDSFEDLCEPCAKELAIALCNEGHEDVTLVYSNEWKYPHAFIYCERLFIDISAGQFNNSPCIFILPYEEYDPNKIELQWKVSSYQEVNITYGSEINVGD